MDKKVNLSAQRHALQSLPAKNHASPPIPHCLDFDVIVTCRYSSKVLVAIDAVDDERIYGQGYQLFFRYFLPFGTSCSYDCVMVRLRQRVIETVITATGLSEDDITKISTAADWQHWEAVTGRSCKDEEPLSEIAPKGKFFLPAFDQQIEECRKSGETVFDLADRAFFEAYDYSTKATS
jgi:hypothetical protein